MKNLKVDESELHRVFASAPSLHVGLAIGKIGPKPSEFAVHHLIPIPQEETDHCPSSLTDALQNIRHPWVREVTKQVQQMLCGGMYVLGLYIIGCPRAQFQEHQDQIVGLARIALAARRQALVRPEWLARWCEEGVALHAAGPHRTQLQARIAGPSRAPRPCDVQVQRLAGQLLTVRTVVPIHVAVPHARQDPGDAVLAALARELAWLQSARFLPTDANQAPQGRETLHRLLPSSARALKLDFLRPLTRRAEDTSSGLILSGEVAAHAVMCTGETLDDAAEALRVDVLTTLHARALLLLDALADTPADSWSARPHALPRRVVFHRPAGSSPPPRALPFCDHLAADETAACVAEHAAQLLGFDAPAEADDGSEEEAPAWVEEVELQPVPPCAPAPPPACPAPPARTPSAPTPSPLSAPGAPRTRTGVAPSQPGGGLGGPTWVLIGLAVALFALVGAWLLRR